MKNAFDKCIDGWYLLGYRAKDYHEIGIKYEIPTEYLPMIKACLALKEAVESEI